eukprot:COSAG04_NODE_4563_length_2016_cov_3.035472_3_plen_141_part_00
MFAVVKPIADDFTPEQISKVATRGNAHQNAVFEAHPAAAAAKDAAAHEGDAALAAYVRAKYTNKSFATGGSGSVVEAAEPAPEPAGDEMPVLQVTVLRGEDLKKMDYFPFTSDPYVIVKVRPVFAALDASEPIGSADPAC